MNKAEKELCSELYRENASLKKRVEELESRLLPILSTGLETATNKDFGGKCPLCKHQLDQCVCKLQNIDRQSHRKKRCCGQPDDETVVHRINAPCYMKENEK